MTEWARETSVGAAEPFHHRELPVQESASTARPGGGPAHPLSERNSSSPLRPTIWVHRVTQPTLVLGSAQNASILDVQAARAAGYDVSTRRSGGGLVVVEPDSSCWIDVVVPVGHELWQDDIGVAFHWLGRMWSQTLSDLGVPGTSVHTGPLVNKAHGRVICFAGIGPGEVMLDRHKVVGLSQRRTRRGARFQGLVVSAWNPDPIRDLIRPDALPKDLDLDALQIGHPSITRDVLEQIPDAFHQHLDALRSPYSQDRTPEGN